MKKLTFLLAIIFISLVSFKNETKIFPQMKGELVSGKTLSLPNDVKGKFTLVSLAYSKKAEEDLDTWQKPLYNKFMVKPKQGGLFSFASYDINMIFVPMFTGIKQKAQGAAKKKLKEGLDKSYYDHVMVFKGKLSDYQDKLGLKDKTVPYFFVLDKEGKIVYTTSGAYSEDKMDDIEDKIEPAE